MEAAIFNLCANYFDYPNVISRHLTNILSLYNFSIAMDGFGSLNIMVIKGNISYMNKRKVFRIPIMIKLYKAYPLAPPVVYVMKSSEIGIVPKHPYVDENGLVRIKYLDNWGRRSKLDEFLLILTNYFQKKSPIIELSHKNDDEKTITNYKEPDLSKQETGGVGLVQSNVTSIVNINTTTKMLKIAEKSLKIQWDEDIERIESVYLGDKERISYHFKVLKSWLPTCEILANKIIIHKRSNIFLNTLADETSKLKNDLNERIAEKKAKNLVLSNRLRALNQIKHGISLGEDYSKIFTITNNEWWLINKFVTKQLIVDDQIDNLFMGLENKLINAGQFVMYSMRIFSDKYISKIECNKFFNSYKTD